jgi:chromosomal replication initiation ATPase DnaA
MNEIFDRLFQSVPSELRDRFYFDLREVVPPVLHDHLKYAYEGKEAQKAVKFVEMVKKDVCAAFGVSQRAVEQQSRKREYVTARHFMFWAMKKQTEASLRQIAVHVVGRPSNHTTILAGIANAEDLILTSPDFRATAKDLAETWHLHGYSEPFNAIKSLEKNALK